MTRLVKVPINRNVNATIKYLLSFILGVSIGTLVTTNLSVNFLTNNHIQPANDLIIKAINIVNNKTETIVLKKWKIVYYQHLRKSGGTAMSLLLRSNGLNNHSLRYAYPKQTYHQGLSFKEVKTNAMEYKMDIIGIEYFPFYTSSYLKHREELWNDVLLLTLLRNPLERVFSELLYHGHFKCPGIGYIYMEINKDKPIEDTMESFENKLIVCSKQYHARYTSNVYSKVYSGVWPYALPNLYLKGSNVDFNPNIKITNIQFELAKLILKEFDVILILEMWNETKLQLKCNGLYNDTLSHVNVGSWKSSHNFTLEMFPRLKQILIELNEYDIKLYEYAKLYAMRNVRKCKTLMHKF
eukprot:186503_1